MAEEVIDYTEQLNKINEIQVNTDKTLTDLKELMESTFKVDDQNILVNQHKEVLEQFKQLDTDLLSMHKSLDSMNDSFKSFNDNLGPLNNLIEKVTAPHFVDTLKNYSEIYSTLHFSIGLFLGAMCGLVFVMGLNKIS